MTGSRETAVVDRWARALHDLYLVTLAIAFAATVVSFPAGADWLVTGAVTAALGAADIAVRRRLTVRWLAVGYFVAAGATVGVVTVWFPMFATVGFGLLPLAFVRLPRWGAVVVGVITTGAPYLLRAFPGDGVPEVTIRFGPAYFVVVGVALPVLTGLFTAGAVQALRRQSAHRQALLDQLSATRAELADASRSAGRAEERQRLAHELHDTLAQGLAGVMLQLDAAEQYLDGDAARLVARARETAGSCLADTRRAVAALRPEQLDGATFAEVVTQVCTRWAETTGVTANCVVLGSIRRCLPRVEVVALRVVQETLANVGKHAGAGEVTVTVTVEYRATELRLTVRDDGVGFDPGDRPSGRFGLTTMRERVASVGGTLSVTSTPGAGATVAAFLPTTGEQP